MGRLVGQLRNAAPEARSRLRPQPVEQAPLDEVPFGSATAVDIQQLADLAPSTPEPAPETVRANFMDALLGRSQRDGKDVSYDGGFRELLGDGVRGFTSTLLTGRKAGSVADEVAQRRARNRQDQAQRALEAGNLQAAAALDPIATSQVSSAQAQVDAAARNAKRRVLQAATVGAQSPEEAQQRLTGLVSRSPQLAQLFGPEDEAIIQQSGIEGLAQSLADPQEQRSGGGTPRELAILQKVQELEAAGQPAEAQRLLDLVAQPRVFEQSGGVAVVASPLNRTATVVAPGGTAPGIAETAGSASEQPRTSEDVFRLSQREEAAKQQGKNEANQLATISTQAQEARRLDNVFAQASALLDQGVRTGPGQAVALPVRQALVDLGIATDEEAAAVSNQEALRGLGATLATFVRSPDSPISGGLPGATSDRDLKFLQSATLSLEKTPAGNRLIIELYRSRLRREQEYASWLDRHYRQTGSLPSEEARVEWANAQPSIIPEQLRKQVEDLNVQQTEQLRSAREIFNEAF